MESGASFFPKNPRQYNGRLLMLTNANRMAGRGDMGHFAAPHRKSRRFETIGDRAKARNGFCRRVHRSRMRVGQGIGATMICGRLLACWTGMVGAATGGALFGALASRAVVWALMLSPPFCC